MKPFSLEEYLKNPSRKVVTRGGNPVKIHCTNYLRTNPIIAEIEGSGKYHSFNADGSYFSDEESVRDLFFAPEKHEGWVNVYRDLDGLMCGSVFATEEDAKCNAKTAIATVKIEWEE